jgi:hypothetical protein
VKAEYCLDDGISATVWPLITCWFRVLVTSTIGGWPLTVIVSATPPTLMSTFTVAMKLPASWIPSRLTVVNPESENVTAYVPGLRSSIEY